MKPEVLRTLLLKILSISKTPLTSKEIAERLLFARQIEVTTQQIGSNLGWLRAAGLVDRRSAPVWGKPYWLHGRWHFATDNFWFHTQVITKNEAMRFVAKMRHDVEARARENQRVKGRPVTYRLPPRSDDMRQMLFDMENLR